MDIIEVSHLTKDYGFNRGVFDVSFAVEQGEVFGFLGPNGAGKTTTIRHIMGFSKPQEGTIRVQGRDSWREAATIKRSLGYLPGELEFPSGMTGTQFIDYMAELRHVPDRARTDELIERFRVNPNGEIARMSLGQKRKLAIVAAFMHDPDVLVLDEPTSGLDPIMQERFIEFVADEKRRGKTILLSSHIFSEVDATCDRIAIIKDGHLVSTVVADELRHNDEKVFEAEFTTDEEYERFLAETTLTVDSARPERRQVRVRFTDDRDREFFAQMGRRQLVFLTEVKFTLEDYFMAFYDRKKSVEEGKEGMAHGLVH
ncbi:MULTISPECIES: ABC transporter ATP-binding protein [Bifidobacterium]|uniref:ABC transporter ATP-binding protein n=2 Tax=Bifidobacterium TaxID=1678 RepID=A0A261FSK3_9BIFI|nr:MULTISPECIES: ATP-binding cassette domain-containing protein [Bifidobacterium]OZG62174.1 ABC transporter ATP-binding protein [Bifidobacterium lemurum]OZG68110.1 ABC transporter ATP-binding protein [Bifidobacterium eulemuris]QOL31823.1 ATP-binding cassette domain-containing protein [Bifidobacterium eulemuris]QOL33551.1 ATP-binding cassette domain-containing protein [Bifidobacterium lemurum]